MRLESSAGFVVFKLEDHTPLYLILHYEEGHWDFPKGHIEPGESELEAALRELKEETSLSVDVIEGFEHRFSYVFKAKYAAGATTKKEVVFFLGKALSGDVKLSEEHLAYEWLPFEEALKKLTYENAKELLRKAHNYITSRLAF